MNCYTKRRFYMRHKPPPSTPLRTVTMGDDDVEEYRMRRMGGRWRLQLLMTTSNKGWSACEYCPLAGRFYRPFRSTDSPSFTIYIYVSRSPAIFQTISEWFLQRCVLVVICHSTRRQMISCLYIGDTVDKSTSRHSRERGDVLRAIENYYARNNLYDDREKK